MAAVLVLVSAVVGVASWWPRDVGLPVVVVLNEEERLAPADAGRFAAGGPGCLKQVPIFKTTIPEGREGRCEIERDFYFFESASGRFEPTTPV